jgi:predicted acyltransferase
MTNPAAAPAITNPATAPRSGVQRLLSLDVVRGITIAFMIMVNNNGEARFVALHESRRVERAHAHRPGVSHIRIRDRRLHRVCVQWPPGARSQAASLPDTVLRAVVLILFGIFVNSFPFFHLAHMRFFGVLQRAGDCYLVCGLFYLYDDRAWTKWAALAGALVGYWVLMRRGGFPGVGMPGRDVPFMDMTQNLTSWIDCHVFPYHLYLYPPDHNVRDPEGLLSDLPAIGTTLMGVLAGIWLRSSRSVKTRTAGLPAACIASLAVGYLWSLAFPLNKNMWTSSFVLVAGGYSLALLTFAFWAVEQMNWRKGWTYVWIVFGSNAIAAYMFSELVPGVLYNLPSSGPGRPSPVMLFLMHLFAHIPDRGWAAFAYSVSFTAFCFIPVWILYKKKIFLKV